jgi:hypothetical protein
MNLSFGVSFGVTGVSFGVILWGQVLTACCPNHNFFVQSGGLIVIMLAVMR